MSSQPHKMFWKQIFSFNKPAFILSASVIIICTAVLCFFQLVIFLKILLAFIIFGAAYFSFGSLLASYFIYDRSSLYKFSWLRPYLSPQTRLYNLYSGYSESGHLLEQAFPGYSIRHFDFFDPQSAVTASIRTAQRLSKPLDAEMIDYKNWETGHKAGIILFMQSLHELRPLDQKVDCLLKAKENMEPGGRIIVVEHLCDLKNFLIYGPGAFHFFGERHWRKAFQDAGLEVVSSFNITPFIKTFILSSHD